MIRLLLVIFFAFSPLLSLTGAEPLLRNGDRVLFLGDSITMDGRYVAYLDLLIRTRLPDQKIETVPLGLASETVSGLSEKDHPWPRPCVLERLGRALEKVKPTVVVACYGMNDGIYHPFSDERLGAYEKGYRELSRQVRAAGARLVILTPPPFDAASFRGQLLPEGAPDYGFRAPFAKYNDTLARYAAWLLSTSDLADKVIDLHGPLTSFLTEWRKDHSDWKNGDGVHPEATQYWLMAGLAAEGLGLPAQAGAVSLSPPDAAGVITVTISGGLPLPRDPAVDPAALETGGFVSRANQLLLLVPESPAWVLKLTEGDRLLAVPPRALLAKGMDLTQLPALSLNRDASPLLDLSLERHRLLGPAWREHVGHTRPDTDRKALPLDQALARAKEIEEKIAAAAKPRQTVLRLAPVTAP